MNGSSSLVTDGVSVHANTHVLPHLLHVEGLQDHVVVAGQLLNGLQAFLCCLELHVLAYTPTSAVKNKSQAAKKRRWKALAGTTFKFDMCQQLQKQ